MAKSTTKRINKLKRASVIPPIVIFILSILIGLLLLFFFSSSIMTSIIDSKSNEIIRQAENLQKDINEKFLSGMEYSDILAEVMLAPNGPISVNIFDGDESYIDGFGEKLNLTDDYALLGDKDSNVFFDKNQLTEEGVSESLNISGLDVFNNLGNKTDALTKVNSEEEMLSMEIYKFNFWVTVDDGEREDDTIFFMQYEETIFISDLIILIPLVVVAAVIFIAIVISQFIIAIVNICSQRKLIKMITHDSVTGGNNFLSYEMLAEKTLGHKRKFGFAVVDMSLQRFNKYSSLYGNEEGDRVLSAINRNVSKRLSKGEIIARVSDANFALLLRGTKDNSNELYLRERMESIIASIPEDLAVTKKKEKPFQGLNSITFKTGMYMMSSVLSKEERKKRKEQSKNIKQLYMKAGIAKQGILEDIGLMVYSHEMWEKEVWEQKVEDTMKDALTNNEFQVYIQPKYNPSTNELMGGEALVRWISPKEGLISPGQFIPIFEKTGFITKLDDYMISNTARLQANWLAQNKQIVPISVNVSRIHFAQPDLAEHIRDLVDQYSLPHKYIEIELTESAFFDDKKALLSTVKKLQEYGFEVSMDDFGAGYSSLNSLKDLPLNVLKLDADFFRGDDFNTRGEIVVSEAISLAKQLNMRIVAEGVEKKEQVDFLAEQDCDMIQGFYFAKPMPADEYEKRMKIND